MNCDDAFLQAVLDNPDDAAPRLIFADWLEERGDPRGVFIRLQCAQERLGPADPVRPELEDQVRELLDRHEAEWTAPLRGVASAWRFRRGFVEEVTLEAAALPAGGALFDAFPIQKVFIDKLRDHVKAVAACPHLARVRVLDVSGCTLRDGGVETLLASPHLTQLTGLDLAGNWLENRAVRALAASPLMPRLNWLNLCNNHALGLAAARALATAPAPALGFLGLSDTNIGLVGLRDLLNSTTLTGLTTLHAGGIGFYGVAGSSAADLAEAPVLSRLIDLDLSAFAGPGRWPSLLRSPAFGRLTSLRLSSCQLRDAGARTLAESPHLANLTSLDLGCNSIGPAGAAALAESPHLAGLASLRLDHNVLRDKGAQAIAESRRLKRLTVLDLCNNGIGGPAVRTLAASENAGRLTTLDLGENYIGLESVEALAASRRLARLTCLRLDGSRLGPAAAHALAQSPHFTRMAALHLNNCQIADEGLRALLHSPHLVRLTELHVRSNGIGAAGVDVLSALIGDSPRWPRLRKLDMAGNPLSGVEQRVLQQRLGARVEL
jgi:uncharacterized protein (TIGR02996 family)